MKRERILSAWLLGVLFAGSLAISAPGVAQTGSSTKTSEASKVPPGVKLVAQMPAAPAPATFHFPQAATKTLSNGLRVFVVSSSEQPAVSVRLTMPTAGSALDPQGVPGIAEMTANLLTQGTATRSAQDIAQAIDFVGGSISASAGADATSANATVVKRDLDLGMDLLSDIVLHPAFKEEELNRRRQQALSNFRVQYSDASYLAGVVFDRLIYGAHPYGLPGEGTPDALKKMNRDELASFHDARYVPGGALLAFAGDVSHEAAFALAEKYFGEKAWPEKQVSGTVPLTSPASAGMRILIIDKPDAVQTQIRVGRPGIARNNPDYIPLYVTNRVFGGGFNSRLNTEVRAKKGLTYGASSSFSALKRGGDFTASTFTRTETTVEATRLVADLLRQMSTGDLNPGELELARDYLAGVFPIQNETPAQVAAQTLTAALYDLPADYYTAYQEKILAVSPGDVKRMTQKYFDPSSVDIALVGSAEKFRDGIKAAFPSAKISEIRFDEVDLLAADLRKPKEAAKPASPEAIARGKALLMEAAEAAGGAAVNQIESLELTATGNIQGPQGPLDANFKTYISYPDKVRVDIDLAMGLSLRSGTDGKASWIASPQGTMDLPPAVGAEQQRAIELGNGWGIYRMALAGKIEAAFVGEEELAGKKVLVVEWKHASGPVKLYIDPAEKLIVGARFNQTDLRGQSAETLQVWSGFKTVAGLKYPTRAVTYRDGQPFGEATVTELKVNVSPDASLFAKPR